MSLKRAINLMNGNIPFEYRIYECDDCFTEIEERSKQ